LETNFQNPQDIKSSPVDDFNLGLLIYLFSRSVLWLVLILTTCISLSLIYLRYAPRIFEASTTLMLKSEKTTQILGVEQYINEQSETEISREMRLLKSVLLIERVVDALPLQIAYFQEGKTKFIFSELYTSSPFVVEGECQKHTAVLEMPIYVKILSPSKVYLGFHCSR
jgi:tyrosine-protein kinase Etk/Wzc